MNLEEKSYASLIIKTEGEMEMSTAEKLSLFGRGGGASITGTLLRDNTPVRWVGDEHGTEYTFLQVVDLHGVRLLQRTIIGKADAMATITTWYSVDVGSAEYQVIETETIVDGKTLHRITYAGIVADSEMLDEKGIMGDADQMIWELWEQAIR